MTLEDKESLKTIIAEANNILMQLQQDLSAVASSRLDLFCRFIIICVYCLQFFFALFFCNKEKQWDIKRHLKRRDDLDNLVESFITDREALETEVVD